MSANVLESHVLGYPRIGANRELKRALESYWKNTISQADLLQIVHDLKHKNWQTQKDAGLSRVTTGDFSFYDHVLDTAMMLGAIPPRFHGDQTVNFI